MRLQKLLVGATVGLSLLAAIPVQAASLTPSQVSAIVSLLQSFGADVATVANVQATLTGQATITPNPTPSPTPSSNTGCVDLPYNRNLGSKGDDVKQLQIFLGVNGNGYFGLQTKKAVMNWQSSHGISVLGNVGPATRAAMGCGERTSSVAYPTTPPIQVMTPNPVPIINIPHPILCPVGSHANYTTNACDLDATPSYTPPIDCPLGSQSNGTQCVQNQISCSTGSHPNYSTHVCDLDATPVYTPPIDCPLGSQSNGTRCVSNATSSY